LVPVQRSEVGQGWVSIHLHNLIKHFPLWSLISSFEMGHFKLPATVWPRFLLCWWMYWNEAGDGVSVLPEQGHWWMCHMSGSPDSLHSLSLESVFLLPGMYLLYHPQSHTQYPTHPHFLAGQAFSLCLPEEDISQRSVCDYLTWLGEYRKQVSACVWGIFLCWTLLFCVAPHPSLHNPKKEKYGCGWCSGFEYGLI
jgi:hypothetical protein